MALSDQQSINEFRKLRDERDRIENLIAADPESPRIGAWKTALKHINLAIADLMDLPLS